MPWLLRRTDDNGNVVIIAGGLTMSEAYRRLVALEARGHKQVYEVKQDCQNETVNSDAPVAQR